MARQEIPIVVLGADGRPAAGASVYVRTAPAGADATIFQARTGAATHPNPRTSDAQGRVTGWLDRGDYAATITVAGLDPWVEDFPIGSQSDGHLDLAEAADGLWTSVKLTPNLRPSNLYRLGVHSARPAATAVEPGTVWRSTDKWMEWISDGAAWTLISAEPQPLAAIPPAAPAGPASAPVDGQRISLALDTTTRHVLRYNAGSASAYKWETEGGGRLYNSSTTASVGSGAWTVPTTSDTPPITAPFAGDWDYDFGYMILTPPVAGVLYRYGLAIGAAAPVDPHALHYQGEAGGYPSGGASQRGRITVPAAATVIRAKIFTANGAPSYQQQHIGLTPHRLG